LPGQRSANGPMVNQCVDAKVRIDGAARTHGKRSRGRGVRRYDFDEQRVGDKRWSWNQRRDRDHASLARACSMVRVVMIPRAIPIRTTMPGLIFRRGYLRDDSTARRITHVGGLGEPSRPRVRECRVSRVGVMISSISSFRPSRAHVRRDRKGNHFARRGKLFEPSATFCFEDVPADPKRTGMPRG